MRFTRISGTAGLLIFLSAVPATARADEPEEQPQYTAPLSQRTQPTYVPQSVAMSGPRIIKDWEEGEPVPPGYHPSTRIRKGPVIAGAILFGVFYMISSLVAAVSADTSNGGHGDAALFVPAIGPFIQMTMTSSATGNWALAVDGLAQSGGVALLAYGLMSPQPVLVRNDLGLTIAPRVMALGREGGGIGVGGAF
jgi:hypothetical protein